MQVALEPGGSRRSATSSPGQGGWRATRSRPSRSSGGATVGCVAASGVAATACFARLGQLSGRSGRLRARGRVPARVWPTFRSALPRFDSPKIKVPHRVGCRQYRCTVADTIVTFDEPPLVEVVASARFEPMRAENGLSLGQAWRDLWAGEFPSFELQAPYLAPTESFLPGTRYSAGIGFGVGNVPPPARAWMSSIDGQHLLQLQNDWFAVNWRRNGGRDAEHDYDRWPMRLATFERQWGSLRAWLEKRGERPVANQLEVTYINHIRRADDVWDRHSEIASVFPGVTLGTSLPANLEELSISARSEIPRDEELPQARMHINVTPAYVPAGSEPEPIFILELTVRGAAPGDGSFEAFGNRARAAIVRAFTAITSPAMQEVWRKQ